MIESGQEVVIYISFKSIFDAVSRTYIVQVYTIIPHVFYCLFIICCFFGHITHIVHAKCKMRTNDMPINYKIIPFVWELGALGVGVGSGPL